MKFSITTKESDYWYEVWSLPSYILYDCGFCSFSRWIKCAPHFIPVLFFICTLFAAQLLKLRGTISDELSDCATWTMNAMCECGSFDFKKWNFGFLWKIFRIKKMLYAVKNFLHTWLSEGVYIDFWMAQLLTHTLVFQWGKGVLGLKWFYGKDGFFVGTYGIKFVFIVIWLILFKYCIYAFALQILSIDFFRL